MITRRPVGITAPTLLIHGSDDPFLPVEGGKDTAESIPGAEQLIIDSMGHDLPREVWPQVADAIAALTEKASKASKDRSGLIPFPSKGHLEIGGLSGEGFPRLHGRWR